MPASQSSFPGKERGRIWAWRSRPESCWGRCDQCDVACLNLVSAVARRAGLESWQSLDGCQPGGVGGLSAASANLGSVFSEQHCQGPSEGSSASEELPAERQPLLVREKQDKPLLRGPGVL